MTVHIPEWVFWILGVVGGLVVLALAIAGVFALSLLGRIADGMRKWR